MGTEIEVSEMLKSYSDDDLRDVISEEINCRLCPFTTPTQHHIDIDFSVKYKSCFLCDRLVYPKEFDIPCAMARDAIVEELDIRALEAAWDRDETTFEKFRECVHLD